MSDVKPCILETVVEEIGGDTGVRTQGKVNRQNGKTKNPKGYKNGKARSTKNVIVKIPSVSRKTDDTKGKLEDIKEDVSENKLTDEDINRDKSTENKENISGENKVHKTVTMTEAIAGSNEASVNKGDKNEDLSDPIYGMFTRTNTEYSLLSNRSESIALNHSLKRNKRKESIVRPKSTHGWSKRDLDLFLPRKSFFCVHDNSLSNAGFDTRSDEERKRPDWRRILRMHTEEELNPPQFLKEEEPVVPAFGLMEDSSEDESFGFENVETAVGGVNSTSGNRGKKKNASKKVVSNEREEYKPLYDYLKYIADNPEEYVQASKYSGKNTDHRHPSPMVRLGRAFRRGHHGAAKNNIFLHAISGLKPKQADTVAPQRSSRNEKGGMKKEAEGNEPNITQDETEIEKLKTKAEKWMKTLTTQQYLKGKEMALKDVGEEDLNMSKWWLALKNCKYLRVPSGND